MHNAEDSDDERSDDENDKKPIAKRTNRHKRCYGFGVERVSTSRQTAPKENRPSAITVVNQDITNQVAGTNAKTRNLVDENQEERRWLKEEIAGGPRRNPKEF